jgi:hypothetical protein
MAISRIIETGARPEQYDEVSGRLEAAPTGRVIHVAAKKEDGTIRVIEVWESRDQAEAFGEKVRAVRQEVGVSGEPSIAYLEVHNLISG